MTDIWTYLKNCTVPIVLYGTGNGADRIIDILTKENIVISGIFSSSDFVRERTFRGIKLSTYEEMCEKYPDMLVLMCFGSSRSEVLEFVKKISENHLVFAPDVPVYGENIFNTSFYEANKELLLKVRSILSDKKSVDTFDKLTEFKLTGKISNLFSCEYSSEDIFSFDESTVFLDLGAYNGDTVLDFSEKYKYKKIIAVEPDRRNFRKLKENTQNIANIEYLNVLISDCNKTVFLDKNKGRGVHESSSGIEINALSIDSIMQKEKPYLEKGRLFIKFDVEGNELKALSGAKDTIKNLSPVMKIACYHRSEDYFTIPLKVLEINPGYKVYMRHEKGIPAWETDFIFIPVLH